MKAKIAILTLVLVAAHTVEAGLIAEWTFTGFTGSATTRDSENKPGATGTPTLSASSSFSAITGTFDNGAISPAIRFAGNNVNPTLTFTLVPASAVQQFQIVYSVRPEAAKGATGNAWSISFDGGSTFSTPVSVTLDRTSTAWQSKTVLFTGSASANQNIVIRDIQSGQVTGIPFTDYDTFQINAVPEPTNIALSLFGIGAIGIVAGRRYVAKRKLAAA